MSEQIQFHEPQPGDVHAAFADASCACVAAEYTIYLLVASETSLERDVDWLRWEVYNQWDEIAHLHEAGGHKPEDVQSEWESLHALISATNSRLFSTVNLIN